MLISKIDQSLEKEEREELEGIQEKTAHCYVGMINYDI